MGLYQVLTRLGLHPDAVLGHSSGEILALSAAGVFQTDRTLERELGRLGSIMSRFESSGHLPEARLVAVATHRDRAEAICRDLGVDGVDIAMDNCPHQVVLAVPAALLTRMTDRLRRENLLFEELPFSRAYHTPSFRPIVGPIAEFFDQMSFRRPSVPIYSCASRGRMPGSPETIRELAVAQWTQTVAFRETIEAMHADGLRLFVDVGARGNLAGFVEDILRGKPSFAVAANLPRRAGLTQLNHLVAATFAHGATLNADYLYARRRPCAIDWNAPEPSPRASVELKIGFPEMKLSDELIERLHATSRKTVTLNERLTEVVPRDGRHEPHHRREHEYRNGNGTGHNEPLPAAAHGPLNEDRFSRQATVDEHRTSLNWNELDETDKPDDSFGELPADDHAVLSFQDTMQAFLRTQQAVMTAYLGGPEDDHSLETGSSGAWPSSVSNDQKLPEPGPWAGEIYRLVAGEEVETRLVLIAHDDPIAQHHTLGGRKISALDPSLLGLPVLPFAVMAEMTAQVAALVVEEGLVLTGLNAVKAHKWVRYENDPVYLELRGNRVSSDHDDRIWVGIFNRGTDGAAEAPRPVFEAIAIFGESVPVRAAAMPWTLENSRPSKFTARSVYAEQWLFHGPLFQAIAHMGDLSERGIEGRLRVLPLEPLVKTGQPATFHTDLVVIDNFTQLLGAWGLDYLAEGDVMFPLHMQELEIHGDWPPVGTEVTCQIAIRELERHRIRVEAQFIRPDGTVWMRINDWEDWRFHWPGRFRDSFRQPRDYLVGEDLPLIDPEFGPAAGASAVWLEPPADMGRPVWRDVLEFTQLGPDERAAYLDPAGTEERRSQRLWGRIAAKEAARRLWNDEGLSAVYPADLAILADPHARPLLTHWQTPPWRQPRSSRSHMRMVSRSRWPRLIRRPGWESTSSRSSNGPPASRPRRSPRRERTLLGRWSGPGRAEWMTRFWCAKEAAAKASRLGLAGGPASAQVIDVNENTGVIHVRLAPELVAGGSGEVCENPLRVVSGRRGHRAWAWTIGKGTKS